MLLFGCGQLVNNLKFSVGYKAMAYSPEDLQLAVKRIDEEGLSYRKLLLNMESHGAQSAHFMTMHLLPSS